MPTNYCGSIIHYLGNTSVQIQYLSTFLLCTCTRSMRHRTHIETRLGAFDCRGRKSGRNDYQQQVDNWFIVEKKMSKRPISTSLAVTHRLPKCLVLYDAVVNGSLPSWSLESAGVPARDGDSKVGMALPTDHRHFLEERRGSWRGNEGAVQPTQ